MSYIDVSIPFALGLYAIFNAESLVKMQDPQHSKKVRLIRRCGLGLLCVAGLYLVIKIWN